MSLVFSPCKMVLLSLSLSCLGPITSLSLSYSRLLNHSSSILVWAARMDLQTFLVSSKESVRKCYLFFAFDPLFKYCSIWHCLGIDSISCHSCCDSPSVLKCVTLIWCTFWEYLCCQVTHRGLTYLVLVPVM